MLHDIDAIIFDFGAVILNLDYHRTVDELSALRRKGLPPLDYRKRTDLAFFDDYEIGTISTQTFREELRKHMELEGTDQALDAAWNAMILDLPEAHLELLKKIRKEKRIFLLSNTNMLHEEYFKERIRESGQYERFADTFEAIYYSHRIHMRKPHPEIFQFVIDKHQLKPKRTLFIDDTLQHVRGAQKTGLKTRHLRYGKETILDIFEEWGISV